MSTEGKAPQPEQTALTTRVEDQSAVRLDACKLVQTTGEGKGPELELSRTETLVGSAEDCDLRVRDATVSRHHFRIIRDAHTYRLLDLDSTNGTFVDNARIKEAFLRPGSLIRAGDVHLLFEPVFEETTLVPSDQAHFGSVLGQSYRMREIFGVLETVAATEATVVLVGETGTGKSALARAIHDASARDDGPFVVVDCGAITPTLVESELFGHERGAFTGAMRKRTGALEVSNGGTLFIDELTELSSHLQPKLLRALEEKVITPVGSTSSVSVDARVIAASQRDLLQEVDEGRFRADLYFRLAVVTIHLPPLRERKEDIPLLVDHFLAEVRPEDPKKFGELSPDLQRKLLAHDYPGNLRELRNTIQRISLMHGHNPFLRPGVGRGTKDSDAAREVGAPGGCTFSSNLDAPFKRAKEDLLSAFEKAYVTRLLDRVGGSVTEAAREAGLDRKHIYNLMSKHKLSS